MLKRITSSHVDLDSMAMREETVPIRVVEAEKEAAFFKTMAQISTAFTVGIVAGLTLIKKK